ncbi:type II secretion system F family protein [Actinophytocola sp.]|uniref:type II secretion system F family protein n=1 Tax=Actinophytocola sp. TaxID=1872138 RepID=UPI002ED1236F
MRLLAALAAVALTGTPAAADTPRATVVVVLDTSGSMKGAWGTAALSAARTYLDALPEDVAAGLVTFGVHPVLSVPPTLDRARLTAALATDWTAPASPVHDAVALAAETAGRFPGQRRVLVLSDCDDLGSSLTRHGMTEALTSHRVTVDVLTGTSVAGGCGEAVRETGGRLLTPGEVADRAAELASAPFPSRPAPPAWPLGLALGTVFVSLLGLGVIGFRRLRGASRHSKLVSALAPYRAAPDRRSEARNDRAPALRPLLRLANRFLRWRHQHGKLADALDLAGLPLRPAEWLLVRAGVSAGLGALPALLGMALVGALVGFVLGWLVTRLYLRMRISRRRGAFADQLPDTLQLVVGALQAGFSLPQALAAVVREDTKPISGEIARALARTRLGVSVEDALEAVAERMGSADFAWTVMAIRIQRQVGGNLAELLTTTVRTMRDRGQLRRHVKALSAEGRLSAYVLIGLPIGLALWMFVSRRSYLEPLYTHPIGWVLSAVAVSSVSLGWFWMSRLVKVEV